MAKVYERDFFATQYPSQEESGTSTTLYNLFGFCYGEEKCTSPPHTSWVSIHDFPLNYRLFIANVSVNKNILKKYFSKYGRVSDIKMAQREPRNFGIVTFASAEAVDAVQREGPHVIEGLRVYTRRAMPHMNVVRGGDPRKLFLEDLQKHITRQKVIQYF